MPPPELLLLSLLLLPPLSPVWIGSESELDEVLEGVRVLLPPRLTVVIGLGVASGFPSQRSPQKRIKGEVGRQTYDQWP